MPKLKTIEHEGKIWTVRELAAKGGRSLVWARRKIREVEAGERTPAEVLELAEKNKPLPKIMSDNLKYVLKEKNSQGRTVKTLCTVESVMVVTGLTKESARRRLSKVMRGIWKPERLLAPPVPRKKPKIKKSGNARFVNLSTVMTPERKAALQELEDCRLGKINANELLRESRGKN